MLSNIVGYPFLIRIFNNLFTDNDKIKIISLNKFLNSKRTKFTFNNKIEIIRNYKRKWFYNLLTNIIVDNIFKFPKSVTHLTFSSKFNKSIKHKIPNSVTHLIFEHKCPFNKSIEGCIPDSVTYLKFGYRFNQPIKNNIPNSVKYLSFGSNFRFEIKDSLPNNLKRLTLGYHFNQSIQNNIPNSVTRLTWKSSYFERLNDCIPNSIIKLIIGKYVHANFSPTTRFPSSLKYLKCTQDFYDENKDVIPKNIEIILKN